ncbi:MAG: hypothetical protein U0175_06630 [Caldilineaceae bacterium]
MPQTKITPAVAMIIVIASTLSFFAFLVYLGCLASGRCAQNYTSEIVTVGICRQDSKYTPLTNVSLPPGQVYYCGEVSGTTRRPGATYLYRDDKVIYSEEFSEYPGVFIKKIPPQYTLEPGSYVISIGYARKTLAKVKFDIRSNQ